MLTFDTGSDYDIDGLVIATGILIFLLATAIIIFIGIIVVHSEHKDWDEEIKKRIPLVCSFAVISPILTIYTTILSSLSLIHWNKTYRYHPLYNFNSSLNEGPIAIILAIDIVSVLFCFLILRFSCVQYHIHSVYGSGSTNSDVGNKEGTRTGEDVGNKEGTRTGEDVGNKEGTRTGEDVGKKEGTRTGEDVGKKEGTRTGEDVGKKEGTRTGEDVGNKEGTRTGEDVGNKEGTRTGEDVGKKEGTRTGEDVGKKEGTRTGEDVGKKEGTRTGEDVGKKEGTRTGEDVGKKEGTRTGEDVGKKEGTRTGEDVGKKEGTRTGEDVGNKEGTRTGEDVGKKEGTRTGEDVGKKEGTHGDVESGDSNSNKKCCTHKCCKKCCSECCKKCCQPLTELITAIYKSSWYVLLSFIILGPILSVIAHSPYIAIAYLNDGYHAGSIFIYYTLVLCIGYSICWMSYHSLQLAKFKSPKLSFTKCTNYAICSGIFGSLAFLSLVVVITVYFVIIPINKSISDAPNRLVGIYQSGGFLIASFVIYKLIVFFYTVNRRSSIDNAVLKWTKPLKHGEDKAIWDAKSSEDKINDFYEVVVQIISTKAEQNRKQSDTLLG